MNGRDGVSLERSELSLRQRETEEEPCTQLDVSTSEARKTSPELPAVGPATAATPRDLSGELFTGHQAPTQTFEELDWVPTHASSFLLFTPH